jgi:phospholipid N-methyltransferase
LSCIFTFATVQFNSLRKKSAFVKEFFREKKQVGAIAPSSKYLMKKMLEPIDFGKAKVIIELGPGNGVFTKGLLAKMSADSKLFSFELNSTFYDLICGNIKDERLILLNKSAEEIQSTLQEHGIEKADYIVSSLPLAVIDAPIKNAILDAAVSHLHPEGIYVQFQYTLNAKKLLESKFKQVKYKFVPANIPPAFVYSCKL